MEGLIAGIDFGSKTSGFTAIALGYSTHIQMLQAQKNKDSDAFLKEVVREHQPRCIGIDAPLSLPGALVGQPNYSNFHMRAADLEAGAMSPMFLGGLTARAMDFAHWCSEQGIAVYEVYPKLVAEGLGLDKKRYKKDATYLPEALRMFGARREVEVGNWHQFDALLALDVAERINRKSAHSIGDELEGVIYF